MPSTVSERYRALVAEGAIAARLTRLEERLAQHRLSRKSSHLGWFFARSNPPEPIKGLYIHGDVGRGKTMLMDMFFAASQVKRKRRAHFHEFMADVHERLNAVRHAMKTGRVSNNGDPIRHCADAIAEETWLLCFDEFHVTDIADAMILGRLFARLFELGVVVVATSNVAPDELYEDGLNRALFLPFIALIEQHMQVVELSARADFRLEKLAGQPVWHLLNGKVLDGKVLDGKVLDGGGGICDTTCDLALDQSWRRLTGGRAGVEVALAVKGRTLRVPRAALG